MADFESPVDLTEFWFNNDQFWFNSKDAEADSILTALFHGSKRKTIMDEIIFYDQIMRHICRHKNIEYSKEYNTTAVKYADSVIGLLDDEKFLGKDAAKRRVFSLLPYRHTREVHWLEYCLDRSIAFIQQEKSKQTPDPKDLSLYNRFRKATIRALAIESPPILQEYPIENWSFSDLLCKERCSFDPSSPIGGKELKSVPKFDADPSRRIIISISGGVDSFVCAFIAKRVLKLDVVAVMINYNNREECDREVEFVRWFCTQLEIPLFVRYITEMTRHHETDGVSYGVSDRANAETDREFYESETKNIRFNAYKFVSTQLSGGLGVPVVLGHNRDDIEENILQNIEKRRSTFNLTGMERNTIYDGVVIHRPILELSKEQIYSIANEQNIPFLRNSTPSWCKRGIMREQIIPHLPKELLDGLVSHAGIVSELYEMAVGQVNAVEIFHADFKWRFKEPKTNNFMFWDMLLKRILDKSNKDHYVSKKSIRNLSEKRFNPEKFSNGQKLKYMLSKKIQLTRDGAECIIEFI